MALALGTTSAADAAPRLSASAGSPASPGFVTRSGRQLLLNGSPYRFTGVNVYNANSVNNYWYTLGTGSGLDSALNAVEAGGRGGATVMRAWFGQWLLKPSGNTVDWSVFDHTVSVARAHGFRLIVTLGDQDGSWDDGIRKTLDSNWYQSGYANTVSPAASSWGARNQWTYKAFVGQVVRRYRNDSTILMWQLMNEAETKLSDGSCSTATDDAGAAALRGFADNMGGYIKSLDPRHLVSLGTIGTGQCGTSGSRYQTVHASPNVDVCEMHDYVADQDIIGDKWNGMRLRLQQCAALNKPLFVGELGIDPAQVGGLQARADRFRAKLTAQFQTGVVGVLAWEWRNPGVNDGDPYVFGPRDPLLATLVPPTAVPGLQSGGWSLHGTATLTSNGVQLTDTAPNTAGSAFWPHAVSSASLSASFDATSAGGNGADGLSLALVDASAGIGSGLGAAGGGLGWSGLPGVAVALDTFQNGADPSGNFVGLATGHDAAHTDNLTWQSTSSNVPDLRGAPRHVDVHISSGHLTVAIDGTTVIDGPISLPPQVLVGFTGGNGGLVDRHAVSNVSIRATPN